MLNIRVKSSLVSLLSISLLSVSSHAYKPAEVTWEDMKSRIQEHSLGEEEFTGKTYSYSGFQALMESYCSAFIIKNPLTQNYQTMTAAHCMGNPDNFNDTARASSAIITVQNIAADSVPVGTKNQYQYNLAQDTFSNVIPKDYDFNLDHVFELAETIPERGEKIYFEGFRYLGLLGLQMATIGNTDRSLSCMYMGRSVFEAGATYQGKNVEPRFTMGHFAYCPKGLLKQGMSGGAVLNSKKEAIGVVSFMIAAEDVANMNYDIVFFPNITKEAYSQSPADSLVPFYNGMKTYFNVTDFNLSTDGKGNFKKDSGKYRISADNFYEFRVQFEDSYLTDLNTVISTNGIPIRIDWYDKGVVCRTTYFGYDYESRYGSDYRRMVWGRLNGYEKMDKPDACQGLD
jgi:hypothetical protein